ncbi:hypothetical protein [Undibacterium sp. Ren11W]|uniref:hypothetical protein n=1 Tax=Undibacterium sp. Ren11W TaxID=3413045 RepID=UPI003BF1033E
MNDTNKAIKPTVTEECKSKEPGNLSHQSFKLEIRPVPRAGRAAHTSETRIALSSGF